MYLQDIILHAVGVARKRVKNTIKAIYIWVGNCIERKKYQLNNVHTILSRYHQHHTCTGFVITIIYIIIRRRYTCSTTELTSDVNTEHNYLFLFFNFTHII